MENFYSLLGAAALLLPASSGFGGQIFGPFPGDHGPVSDTFTVFDPSGNVFAQYILTEFHESTDGAGAIHSIPIVGLANPKNDLTKVLESRSDSSVSDVFGSVRLNYTKPDGTRGADWFLALTSDTETQPAGFGSFAIHTVFGTEMPADGWDETHNLAQEFRDRGFTARFKSDVPDGGFTAGMLGLGLMGLGSLRRMARK